MNSTMVTDKKDCNSSEKASKINISQTANGDINEESLLSFSPRPKRIIRINRRAFHCSELVSQSKPQRVDEKSDRIINFNSENKKSIPSPVSVNKKVITLSSKAKDNAETNSESSKKERSSNCIQVNASGSLKGRSMLLGEKKVPVNVKNVSSEEVQPKKKHKPITWP